MNLTFNQWVEKLSKKQDLKLMYQVAVFEEIVIQLVQWWKDKNPDKDFEKDNDFSTLKVLKLHFFVCAVDTKKDSENTLLDIFQFYAMPYGHVCKDIYDYIKKNKGEFDKFTLTNKGLKLKINEQ